MRRPLDLSVPDPLTPIYNALCAEYGRLFRSLPGDRSEEEAPLFDVFAPGTPGGSSRGRYEPGMPALPPGRGEQEDGAAGHG